MNTDADLHESALEKSHIDETLLTRARRLAYGYTLALALLVGSLLASYTVLHSAILTQQRLSNLNTHVNDMHLALIDTISIMTDYRAEGKNSRTNPRIRQLIKNRLADAVTETTTLENRILDTTETLQGSSEWADIAWLVDDSADGLHHKLGRYIGQLELSVSTQESESGFSTLPLIPVDAAGSRDGALALGYRRASEQLSKRVDDHSAWLDKVHRALMLGIAISMLLISLLVVSPLWRSMVQEHRRLRKTHANLRSLAYTDRETGLPNLAGLELEPLHDVEGCDVDTCVYLLALRITNIDVIYNLIGRQNGQELHTAFSERLRDLPLPGAIWARGADSEYTALLAQADIEQSEYWAVDVHSHLVAPLRINDVIVRPQLSMAAAPMATQEPTWRGQLFEHQTRARAASHLFDPTICNLPIYNVELTESLIDHNSLVEAIGEGVQQNEFVPYYQIKVEADSGRPTSMEALCRWQHADGSIDGPYRFIETAERSGHIVAITYQLLDQVVNDITTWTKAGLSVGRVSVNFSADVLLHPEVLDKLAECLSQLPPVSGGLEIEVTENVALGATYNRIHDVLSTIRDMGIPVAMDDFGTGYASLQTLIDLPFDFLKIDKCFVDHMQEDGGGCEVISAMISLANKMNKPCIIEGVETDWQWRMLLTLGADELQGYLFHRPASASDTQFWLLESEGLKKAS